MINVTREGEQLELHGSMLEIVRPVYELLLVSWALGRDSNNSFLNPDPSRYCLGHSQVYAHCICTYIFKKNSIINAFFLY